MSDSVVAAPENRAAGQDFIRAIVAEDVRKGTHGGRVVTRFPPEPNGYLHIGHAKSITLNFGIAQEFGGVCHLRFDDTNPETENAEYVEAIIRDVKWLGWDWGEHLYFASDYFEKFYEIAEELIRKGKAYVDSQTEEEIREQRGTITEPGRPSPYRDRSVEENLDLFRRMRAGEFPDGAHVLRAKIDMASPNMLLRDPVLYRIRHAPHYRTGDRWCIYPMYDFAHPLEDAIEDVTHSICTLEFETNRPLYDWVVENADLGTRPRQYEFARLNLDYTVMSKRKLLQLVEGGYVSGWDDPRMPTIAGLRRRGVTPEAIRAFCEMIGVTKADSRVDIGKLEYAIRTDLNTRAPRVLCVLDPLRVVITNWPAGKVEMLDAPYWPHDVPKEGSRPLPFSGELLIERSDFAEDPPPGWHRLAPGREVRLRYGYIIRCDDVVKNDRGEVVELRCSYDPATRGGATPDGRVVKGTIHWVSAAHAVPCEVRLYDRLFTVPDPEAAAGEDGDFKEFLNPESLVVIKDARIEPSARDTAPGTHYQFERLGYFFADPVDSAPGALVFNRVVTLRDTWAKRARAGAGEEAAASTRAHAARREQAAASGAAPETRRRREAAGAAAVTLRAGETSAAPQTETAPGAHPRPRPGPAATAASADSALVRRLAEHHGLGEEEAELLARDPAAADLFERAIAEGGVSARAVANWVIHELPRERAGRAIAELPFGAKELAALVRLVEQGRVSSTAARQVLAELAARGGDPERIVEEKGLSQISDTAELERVVRDVLAANAAKVAEYRAGKTGLIGFFMGQVMGRTRGRANPEKARELLVRELGG